MGNNTRVGISTKTRPVIGIMLVLIFFADALIYVGWDSYASPDMTLAGWLAMTFGVIVMFVLGMGLASLIYSNRRSQDL